MEQCKAEAWYGKDGKDEQGEANAKQGEAKARQRQCKQGKANKCGDKANQRLGKGKGQA